MGVTTQRLDTVVAGVHCAVLSILNVFSVDAIVVHYCFNLAIVVVVVQHCSLRMICATNAAAYDVVG